MSSYNVGYDFDGVIASEKRSKWFEFAVKWNLGILIRYFQYHAPCLRRPYFGIIISCRPSSEQERTEAWMERNGLDLQVYCVGSIHSKAAKIDEFSLDRFTDNSRENVATLNILCPETDIILDGEIR